MTNPLDYLRDIPLDKYLHALSSVVIFAALHFCGVAPLYAFWAASGAHVVKKAYDIARGLRDRSDIVFDIAAGVAGAALAWACIPVLHG